MAQFDGGELEKWVDFSQPSLLISACAIMFNPLFWNIVARREYRTHFLTRLLRGNAQLACYALALTIFTLGLFRDFLYERALRAQPASPFLLSHPGLVQPLAYALLLAGNVLVWSSTWALGITGTFLGDYFGFLLDDMVTGFPFNVTGAPMYWGSTACFAGSALLYGKVAGLVLTGWVACVYKVALGFEDQFTREIYERRDRERAKEGRKGK